jgi:uncharacterized protein
VLKKRDEPSPSLVRPASVLRRSVYRGQVRWALPNLLLEATSDRIVTCILPGVICKAPIEYEHYVRQLLEGWEMTDHVWHTRRVLSLTTLGAAHSLDLHWDHATDAFLGWYVNLQEPVRPTPLGYDTFDQMLDIWIEPDGSWRWKDWEELVEAERVGLFTRGEAGAIRAEGRRVIERLDRLLPTGWEDWRPDPSVELPTLPPEWDRIW